MAGRSKCEWAGRRGDASGGRWVLIGLLTIGSVGCEKEEVKRCHAEMKVSQDALLEMDSEDIGSVEQTLAAVEATLAACEAADRPDEVRDVRNAQRQVGAHLKALQDRAAGPERKKLNEAELAELVTKGDPDCPRGQGYEHGPSKKMIRCTGPLLTQMTLEQAKEHFTKRGFKITSQGQPPVFEAEYGATRYRMVYASGANQAPSCTEATAPPGVPWQEWTARLTGAHPQKLERGKPVPTSGGPVPLSVEGSEQQVTVKLGTCAAAEADEVDPDVEGRSAGSPDAADPDPSPE